MRRLEIARCLVANPQIIMLDEPFAGIDPVTVQGVQVVIRELAEAGIAVLITDHAAREILQITDRTYVVSQGRILCSGTADEIVAHPEVRQKYLGDIDMVPSENKQSGSGTAGAVSPAAGFNQVDAAQAIAAAQQLLAAQQSSNVTGVNNPPAPGKQTRVETPVSSTIPETQTPAPSPQQKPSAASVEATKKSNNIPLPNMAVKPNRRARKVVAPFKSTDLDK